MSTTYVLHVSATWCFLSLFLSLLFPALYAVLLEVEPSVSQLNGGWNWTNQEQEPNEERWNRGARRRLGGGPFFLLLVSLVGHMANASLLGLGIGKIVCALTLHHVGLVDCLDTLG